MSPNIIGTVVAPIAVYLIIGALIRNGILIRTYSSTKRQAILSMQFPAWFIIFRIGAVICFAIPMILAFLVAYVGVRGHGVHYYQNLVAKDAIFFNPTGWYVLTFGGFCLVIFGGFSLLASLNIVLPYKVRAYLAINNRKKKQLDPITPQSGAVMARKIVTVIYTIVLMGMLVALPLYTSVSAAGLRHISVYPMHQIVSLSDMRKLEVRCITNANQPHYMAVTMTAVTAKGDVPIITKFQGGMPMGVISLPQVRALYAVMKTHNIPVSQSVGLCQYNLPFNPEDTDEYNAFFQPV